VSTLESRHVSILVNTVNFLMEIQTEVPTPYFLIAQVPSVTRIEVQQAKNKNLKPQVPIPYLTFVFKL
jgi:hypothetical protein